MKERSKSSHYQKGGKKRKREGGEAEIVLNIEIDGPHHQRHSHQHDFDELRDAYLSRNHGIKVVRVDLTTVKLDGAKEFFQDVYARRLFSMSPPKFTKRHSNESQESLDLSRFGIHLRSDNGRGRCSINLLTLGLLV